ncbi:MAG: HD domain-containing protein [Candidatus Gracilibacteria bacterium]|nr:HD domain-containing protein [Candidatus Gracilibacteria bacterium]
MIGILLKLIYTRGLSIKRWSNFPRIEDVTPLDNAGYVIHVALFLAYLEEKHGKKPVDKEYIIKRVMFDLFKSLVLSDINSGTRDYINKIDGEIMTKLEKRVEEYLFSFEGGEFIKEDMKKILGATDKKLENEIILASKKFAGYNECLVNSRVFLFTYDVAMDQIQDYFDKNKSKLHCLKQLVNNDDYKKYLGHIRRLSHCKRWSGRKRNYDVSVMSHLVMVTFISYVLGNLENIEGEANYDVYKLMLRSLYHDIPEAITGDIITPTKKAIPGFRKVLEEVEKKMMNDYFFVYVGDDYKKMITDYMLEPFFGSEGELAKKADIISAMFEAKIERDTGNPEFNNIYRSIKKDVNDFSMISCDHFLKEIIMSFEEDYSDLDLGKDVK